MSRVVGRAFVSLVLVAVFAGVLVASATAAAPPTQVDSCTTIDQPGRYVLTSDVTNGSAERCLHVRADDIVLDGRGHTVGTGTAAAVSVNASGPLANVTVQNVRVTGAREGVEVDTVAGARVVGVEARQNGVGVGLYGTRNATVRDGVAAGNDVAGVRVRNGDGTLVRNVTTRGNTGANFGDPAGIALSGTTNATLLNNAVADEYDGIALRDSDGAHVAGNTVRSSNNGVAVLAGSTGNVLRTNALRNSRIVLQVRDDAVPMTDNVVADNSLEGAGVRGSGLAHDLSVRGNELVGGPGVRVDGANGSVVRNVVRESTRAGVAVAGENATVRGNRVTGASGNGVHVDVGGSGARLANNVLVGNDGHGVALGTTDRPAVTDVVLRNTVIRESGGQAFHATGGSTATARNVTLATATVDFRATNVAFGALDDPPAPPEGTTGVDQYLRAAATDGEASLDLRFHYEQRAATDVDESTLRLYAHDDEWQPVESQTDPGANTVAGSLERFGAVGVLGERAGGEPTPTATTTATETATATATATEDDGPDINPTVRPGATPTATRTPSPTATQSPTPTAEPGTETVVETTATTQPGFGVGGVLVALLALAAAAVRRTG